MPHDEQPHPQVLCPALFFFTILAAIKANTTNIIIEIIIVGIIISP